MNSRINLLYIITKLELGGAQKQLLQLMDYLDKEKFRLFLFTAKDGLLMEDVVSREGLTVRRSLWLERPINPCKDILAFIEMCRFIRKNKIVFVHTHSSKAGILGRWAAKFAGAKKIFHTVHGWSFHNYQNFFLYSLFLCLEKVTAVVTDKIVVVSEQDRRKGLSCGIGDETKYTLIPYGIRHDDFVRGKRQATREELGIGNEELVVGNISCFKPQKCTSDFVRIAVLVNKIFPETKFLLVGDGRQRKRIEKLMDKFSLRKNFILTGWRRDIPDLLAAMDVFVLTSLWEGLPISVLEAMAAAKPVVVTDTGGIREVVIEAKAGFVVDCRQVQSISERVIRLLRDRALRDNLGKNGADYLAGRFNWKETAQAHNFLYNCFIHSVAVK